jgi:hypothetical protein
VCKITALTRVPEANTSNLPLPSYKETRMASARKQVIGFALTALFPLLSFAQSSSKSQVCERFDHAIDRALKAAASIDAEGVTDNSAPRSTLRELKINNQLQIISMNLGLRRDNGCPPLTEPVVTARYLLSAMKCQVDITKMTAGQNVEKMPNSSLPATCDTSRWEPIGSEAMEGKPTSP